MLMKFKIDNVRSETNLNSDFLDARASFSANLKNSYIKKTEIQSNFILFLLLKMLLYFVLTKYSSASTVIT